MSTAAELMSANKKRRRNGNALPTGTDDLSTRRPVQAEDSHIRRLSGHKCLLSSALSRAAHNCGGNPNAGRRRARTALRLVNTFRPSTMF